MKKQSPYLESWLLSFAILVFFNTEVAASKEINIENSRKLSEYIQKAKRLIFKIDKYIEERIEKMPKQT